MANKLNMDLRDKHVVVTRDVARFEEVAKRVMLCTDGNGLLPENMGQTVFGKLVHDETQHLQRADGRRDIERLATDEEVKEALAIRKQKVGW